MVFSVTFFICNFYVILSVSSDIIVFGIVYFVVILEVVNLLHLQGNNFSQILTKKFIYTWVLLILFIVIKIVLVFISFFIGLLIQVFCFQDISRFFSSKKTVVFKQALSLIISFRNSV